MPDRNLIRTLVFSALNLTTNAFFFEVADCSVNLIFRCPLHLSPLAWTLLSDCDTLVEQCIILIRPSFIDADLGYTKQLYFSVITTDATVTVSFLITEKLICSAAHESSWIAQVGPYLSTHADRNYWLPEQSHPKYWVFSVRFWFFVYLFAVLMNLTLADFSRN